MILLKLIFGLIGALLSLVWWMVKVWFAVFVGVLILAVGHIFFW